MFYYHIWVRSTQFRGGEALTYRHNARLVNGSIVRVQLRDQEVLGIVKEATSRPTFTTKIITSTLKLPPLPVTTLKLASWLQAFYPSSIGVTTSLFLPRILSDVPYLDYAVPLVSQQNITVPPLTRDQEVAISSMENADTYLLHGRTGSGKTRLYLELTARVISKGQSVMVLSPEIGLISQLAINFENSFGNQVVVLHSRLSAKERQRVWIRILTAMSPLIVIGPRSVLFSPLHDIGLIIVDESHDQAYKQEQAPYYNGIRVASRLSVIHGAMLILGSATPSVSDYYLALKKKKTIIRLDSLAKAQQYERKITIVDLKDRDQFSRVAHLSLKLLESISYSLARGEQTLLYLNRRGTARVTLCTKCGWQSTCPNCDTPLVYHGDHHLLRCHICGYSCPVAINCPECSNPSITFRSFGTKAIVEEVQHVFPEAHVVRFDADNLKNDRLENRYQQIINGKVDIIVGTQMLAKGLDLPLLSTLGVILADSSLYVPDYTANEHMYQLLTQVIGRIGRGHVESHAIIQTYQSNSRLLRAALYNEWTTFYGAEIAERKKYFFPPFCHLLKLTCNRASSLSAEKTARAFIKQLASLNLPVQIEGPAPAFHEKNNGKYVWQIVIKARERSALLATIAALPHSGWNYDLDPADLL